VKTLYFSRTYSPHDWRFLSAVASFGHDVAFLQLDPNEQYREFRPLPAGVTRILWDGGPLGAIEPEDWDRHLPVLEVILNQYNPDLVHAGPIPSCAYMIAECGFHPFIAMSWGSDILIESERDELKRLRTIQALREADCFLCDCMAVHERAMLLSDRAELPVVQFPWGIDLKHFSPTGPVSGLRVDLGWQNETVVLSTRSWEPGYDVDIVLEAFAEAALLNRSLRLILLGSGSLDERINGQIAEHGLEDLVCRPGRISQDKLPCYYRASDVYLSCAPSDGSSISLLEALGTGLPVIAADAPGNREWIVPGAHGWLELGGDSQAFALAIVRAAEVPLQERMAIGLRNRALAEERADWSKHVTRLREVYSGFEQSAHIAGVEPWDPKDAVTR
jgi:glycosyltransferase involved in cell wall biosynthesis